MFKISSAPIDVTVLKKELEDARAGALVTFEGWVRARNDGRAVLALDYEAYVPLAEKEGNRILVEARSKFPLVAAVCVHRTGALALGDLAVWVGVTAEHRAAAFDGCRFIIDETKARLPIWKREHYEGGTQEWINCATGPS